MRSNTLAMTRMALFFTHGFTTAVPLISVVGRLAVAIGIIPSTSVSDQGEAKKPSIGTAALKNAERFREAAMIPFQQRRWTSISIWSPIGPNRTRSAEHTSEIQTHMRRAYAVVSQKEHKSPIKNTRMQY